MSIIMNERKFAIDALSEKSLGKKPIETLSKVAKYYISEGHSKEEARSFIADFLTQCDGNASPVVWAQRLDFAIANAVRFPMIELDHIRVTKGELDTIGKVPKRQIARLAFVLLCVSKYWDEVNPLNDHWVNERDSDIMRMANINTSIRRQSQLFAELRSLGLIRFSNRVDNLNVQVLFSEESGITEMEITDFRNLGYQYLKYLGEPYIECACCGLTVRKNTGRGQPKSYCDACAAKRRLEQNVNSVMKLRSAKAEKQALT